MDQEIIKIFHNKIMPSVREKGPTYIGDWPYYVNFDSNLDDNSEFKSRLVIDIKDDKAFDNALIEYTRVMMDHLMSNSKLQEYDNVYFDGNMSNIIESVLLNVWFNATEEDFKNPVNYLKYRTNFLTDEFSNSNLGKLYIGDNIEKLNNYYIKSYIDVQNPSANETPFVFKSKIVLGSDEYLLPNVSYGISDGKCYIYAVHGKKLGNSSPFEKKVNRLLYKANKDLEITDEDENIKDVSLSQIFALTIFIKMLKDTGINDIVVKNFYPVRSDNKDIVIKSKLQKLKNIEPSRDDVKYNEWLKAVNDLEKEADMIQNNIINKYLRNFRRLEYHFSNVGITSYPYDVDNNMHIKLSEYSDYDKDNILNDVYESIDFSKKLQK